MKNESSVLIKKQIVYRLLLGEHRTIDYAAANEFLQKTIRIQIFWTISYVKAV